MDLAAIATLITAVSAGIASAFGIYFARKRDSVAARGEARTVATEATEAALAFLKAALDHAKAEIGRLGERVDELERDLVKCRVDHEHKSILVARLERRAERLEIEREGWTAERAQLTAKIAELGGAL